MRSILIPTLALVLCACSTRGGAPVEPPDTTPSADVVAGDTVPAPDFSVTIFTHDEAAGRTGIAVPGAAFSGSAVDSPEFAFEYPPIPVDAAYEHVLNFMHTPFLPPWRKAAPTHGPLILFTDDLDTIVFSPMDHFFAGLIERRDGAIHYGLWGEIDQVPGDFVHRFILVQGKGINATVQEWGRLLRADRGKAKVDRYADQGLSYLSYWTDNGAAYYYETGEGMNEAETLLALKADADARGIPLGSLQIDSWWYSKIEEHHLLGSSGLLLWEPKPEMFPEGLTVFQEALGLPLIAHNRWFSDQSPYLDEYAFVVEGDRAFPTGPEIYQHFMASLASWGGMTYEQDWLITQYWDFHWLRSDVGRATRWMGWMDDAAAAEGLTMQLCMPGAAHLMDSVDRASVTTTRTSTDYSPGISKESYWAQFHTVNMIAGALGLLPFKDNFWSSEEHGEAEALVSILSAGMVGAGDAIGDMNRALLLRTCRDDGLLLKPDRPAVPLDAMFLDHSRPYTVTTGSRRDALGETRYLAAFHLAGEHPEHEPMDAVYAMATYDGKDLNDLFVYPDVVTDWAVDLAADLDVAGGRHVLLDWRAGIAAEITDGFDIPELPHLYDFAYFVLAPVQDNGMALLGETAKYVTLADRRFTAIAVRADGFALTLAGIPGEAVEVLAFDADAGALVGPVEAIIGADGAATVDLIRTGG
jgi:hypothetical protein